MSTIPLEVGDIVWARTAEGLQRMEYTGNERDAEMDLTHPAQFARVARRVANRLGLPLEGRVEVAPLAGRFVVVVGSEAAVIPGTEKVTAFAGVLNGPAVSRGADAAVEVLDVELAAVDEALGFDRGSTRSEGDRVRRIKRLREKVIELQMEGLEAEEAYEAKLSAIEAESRLREAVEAARLVPSSEALPSEPVAAVSDVMAGSVVHPIVVPGKGGPPRRQPGLGEEQLRRALEKAPLIGEPRRKRGSTGHRGPKG